MVVCLWREPGPESCAPDSLQGRGHDSSYKGLMGMQVYNLSVENPDFSRFLLDPTIPRQKKAADLGTLLEGMGFSSLSKNFFCTSPLSSRLLAKLFQLGGECFGC
jgi:hypothetical protein